jgi:hypothetical protein
MGSGFPRGLENGDFCAVLRDVSWGSCFPTSQKRDVGHPNFVVSEGYEKRGQMQPQVRIRLRSLRDLRSGQAFDTVAVATANGRGMGWRCWIQVCGSGDPHYSRSGDRRYKVDYGASDFWRARRSASTTDFITPASAKKWTRSLVSAPRGVSGARAGVR